jgi:hypothetical protein
LDTRQQPFKSILAAFKKTLLLEAVRHWLDSGAIGRATLPQELSRKLNVIEQFDFDERLMDSHDERLTTLRDGDTKKWLKLIKEPEKISEGILELSPEPRPAFLLIDRIDDSWDGSDTAVIFLMGLMHACVEIGAATEGRIRPVVFLRENIFERVRQLDNEFARLETAVVSLDWTKEQLRELVERRINASMITKKPLGGETWDSVFAEIEGNSSIDYVANFCQHRPRDVLTYCTFALDSAKSSLNQRVEVADILSARKRFSDSRLKDLGDEYAENYPHLSLVLSRFFGLGDRYTLGGVSGFIQRLLVDSEVQERCSGWLRDHTVPESFADLMYRISFFGISSGKVFEFRSAGARSTAAPKITTATEFMIHPCFHDALHLRRETIANLDASIELKAGGVVPDLPQNTTLSDYQDALQELLIELEDLPRGNPDSARFEDVVGRIIKLCFFSSLTNVEAKVRTSDGRSIRDWVCANTAPSGFWEMIRMRYQATQVIWECKNYDNLHADDFHQANYYMGKATGRCVVVAFRGEATGANVKHVNDIINKDGIVIPLGEKDLKVFIRQAIKGKARESHIQGIFDRIVRSA